MWERLKEGVRKVLHAGNDAAVGMGIDTASMGASVLDMYESSDGVYHASTDCWQQYFGYNSVYDFLFDVGTSMSTDSFEFEYDNSAYVIWVWKGDYVNLGAGAELGIYYGGGPHWLVNTELAMPMSMQLSYNGKNIISHSQNTWWITGFNSNYLNVQASDLSAMFVVCFPNSDMYHAFAGTWNGVSGWVCNPNNYSATLHF